MVVWWCGGGGVCGVVVVMIMLASQWLEITNHRDTSEDVNDP